MTISADMCDDAEFLKRLENGTYQLAVTHEKPADPMFFSQKCGHEDLLISVVPGHPLAFYPKVQLSDLNGLSILLLSRIGFWANMHREKTPDTKYLLQVESSTFMELVRNSGYPSFTSSYYLNRNEVLPDRINIPIEDKECHTDFFLVCLDREKKKYTRLFDLIHADTIL